MTHVVCREACTRFIGVGWEGPFDTVGPVFRLQEGFADDDEDRDCMIGGIMW